LLYLGYAIGIVTSLLAAKITALAKGQIEAIAIGLLLFSLSLLGVASGEITVLFGSIFLLCAGMFIAHSILSSLTNSLLEHKKGITNGLYLSFYYSGGALGSTLPGLLYEHFGWYLFVASIASLLLAATALLWRHRPLYAKQQG